MSSRSWKITAVELPYSEDVLASDPTSRAVWVTHNMPFVQYLSTTVSSDFSQKHQIPFNTKALPLGKCSFSYHPVYLACKENLAKL